MSQRVRPLTHIDRIHTAVDAFLQSADLGKPYLYMALAAAILFVVAAVVTVCRVLHWQKNRTLDIAVAEQLKI